MASASPSRRFRFTIPNTQVQPSHAHSKPPTCIQIQVGGHNVKSLFKNLHGIIYSRSRAFLIFIMVVGKSQVHVGERGR